MYSERNFIIFNISEIDSVDFSQFMETSKDTVRKSMDGTKTFVKWEGESIPSSVESITTKEGTYSYDDMMVLLSTPEWYSPMPYIEISNNQNNTD